MKIGILGTRGVPARYGGFETFAEELGKRLVKRGHEVTVYCRRRFNEKDQKGDEYKGIKRVVLPAPHHKYLETPVHTLFSFIHLFKNRVDVVLLCNAANSPMAWLGRLARIPLVINVDGIERRRKKWNALGRLWYRLGEFCSVLFANRIVSDADVIAEYYQERYKADSTIIRYGAEDVSECNEQVLSLYRLTPQKYLLYVSRLEPENNALGVIQAYQMIDSDMPLVVVGDAPYATDYINSLREIAGPNVIFMGYRFGDDYKALGKNCYAYIQATEVGGTHPALVEAMARGNCIVANDVPEHREVLLDTGVLYRFNDFKDLAEKLEMLLKNPEIVKNFKSLASKRAQQVFSWDTITDQYEELFKEVVR